MDSLPARLAQASLSTVDGTRQRHVPAKYTDTALVGRATVGRWGTEDGFLVLYLGRQLSVSEILDLRLARNRQLAGLSMQQLQSETHDRSAYAACQNVSAVAHQLGYHGLVAPAATNMGETLVLFTDLLSEGEQPVRVSDEPWFELPTDPRKHRQGRHLRVVE